MKATEVLKDLEFGQNTEAWIWYSIHAAAAQTAQILSSAHQARMCACVRLRLRARLRACAHGAERVTGGREGHRRQRASFGSTGGSVPHVLLLNEAVALSPS